MSETTSTSKGLQPYIIQEWVNGENTNTPISAERLTHMEVGIGDLSKTLLDGREPSYTVTSETAPVPSTPCLLVVIDETGLYKGTWRDDGKTRTQVGWGPAGDQELYSYRRKQDITTDSKDHSHDWATLTRHGVMVDLSGSYTPNTNEHDVRYPIYLSWITIPVSCQPPHELYGKSVTQISANDAIGTSYNYQLPGLYVPHVIGLSMPQLIGIGNADRVYFHATWMTDAAALPASVVKSAVPEAIPTVQAPAAQPAVSQASAGQEQVSSQAPAQASPAHAAPEQTPDVQAPAVQDAPTQTAGTARHAKQELEE